MYKTFDEMINNCGCLSGSSLVAAAADRETIEAVKMAFDKGLGHAATSFFNSHTSCIFSGTKLNRIVPNQTMQNIENQRKQN